MNKKGNNHEGSQTEKEKDVYINNSIKRKVITIFVIILIGIILGIYLASIQPYGSIDCINDISYKQEKVADGWIITITNAIQCTNDGWNYDDIEYSLNGTLWGWVNEINGTWDEHRIIIFYDNDNNNLINKNDTFYILKNSQYQIESGTWFWLDTHGIGFRHIQLE